MRTRNFKIDVLKTLAICFIVIHHLVINNVGLAQIESNLATPNYMSVFAILNAFVIVGVNIFFLVSGYLGMSFKPKKAFRITFEIYSWWILLYIIFLLLGINVYGNVKNAFISILTSFNNYWFIVVYIVLMALTPVLNKLALQTSKKEAISIICMIFLVGCVITFCITGQTVRKPPIGGFDS